MKRFAYALDPLCLAAVALYLANRAWFAPAWGGAFLRGQFNDLLLVPAALPLVLWLQRQVGLRGSDQPPSWSEIGLHLATWAVTAELIAPHLWASSTGDWRDVAAYGVGAVLAGCRWQGLPAA